MNSEKVHINPNLVIGAAGVGLAAFLIYKATSNVKGLLTPAPSAGDVALQSQKSLKAWDPNYWQSFGNPPAGGKLLYWSQVITIADALNSDLGSFYIPWLFSTAKPEKVVSDVQQLKNQAQFSQLVWYFNKTYGDLFTKMYKQLLGGASGTPAATLQRIIDYVSKLPA